MHNPPVLNSDVPLFVDLDGTLILGDVSIETALALLRRNPVYLLLLPWWMLRGKAYTKARIAERVELDAGLLPYNMPLLEFVRAEVARGRTVVLVTASHRRYAEQVAQHTGGFAAVIATDDARNLAGDAKLAAILDHTQNGPFEYAGNARKDVAVWRRAQGAVVVNASDRTLGAAGRVTRIVRVFDTPRPDAGTWLAALRLHQWSKNLLLAVPLLTAHQWNSAAAWFDLLIAFVAFSACASAVYVLNDLADLDADRRHAHKRLRPFAAGTLSAQHGLLAIPFLLLFAFALAWPLPRAFHVVLATYVILAGAYSLYLKRLALVDVTLLAGLYALRVLAGAIAIGVPLSFWLLAFSTFLFFSLALLKRCAELGRLAPDAGAPGRAYRGADVTHLRVMGIASGYLAVLVFALFINSPEVAERYVQPQRLWLSCPALLYWISRMWIHEARAQMHDDPLVFALRDVPSHAVLGWMVLVVWIAT